MFTSNSILPSRYLDVGWAVIVYLQSVGGSQRTKSQYLFNNGLTLTVHQLRLCDKPKPLQMLVPNIH